MNVDDQLVSKVLPYKFQVCNGVSDCVDSSDECVCSDVITGIFSSIFVVIMFQKKKET